MAIYNLDSINEKMNTKKNNDLLDNLIETCDQMLNMIDEGVAYKKELNRYLDQDKKLQDKQNKYSTITNNTSGAMRDRAIARASNIEGKRDELARKNSQFSKHGMDNLFDDPDDIPDSTASDTLQNDIRAAKHNDYFGRESRDALRKMKHDYASRHGDVGNDIRNKKPGQIQDLYDKIHNKPKAKNESAQIEYIKETCEYILSIIDEM